MMAQFGDGEPFPRPSGASRSTSWSSRNSDRITFQVDEPGAPEGSRCHGLLPCSTLQAKTTAAREPSSCAMSFGQLLDLGERFRCVSGVLDPDHERTLAHCVSHRGLTRTPHRPGCCG